MKWLSLLYLLLPLHLLSQSVQIREIKLKPDPRFYNTTDSTIIYPIVITRNHAINRFINDEIERQLFEPDSNETSVRRVLRREIAQGLTDLSYEVTCNKNGLLSIKIDIELTAGTLTNEHFYLNFDCRTGQPLAIEDVVDERKFEQFKQKVFADKIDSLKAFKDRDLKTRLLKKELEPTDFQSAVEYIDNNCLNDAQVGNFSLSDTAIEIIDGCEFPRIMAWLEPGYELKYSFDSIADDLKPRFRSRIRK